MLLGYVTGELAIDTKAEVVLPWQARATVVIVRTTIFGYVVYEERTHHGLISDEGRVPQGRRAHVSLFPPSETLASVYGAWSCFVAIGALAGFILGNLAARCLGRPATVGRQRENER